MMMLFLSFAFSQPQGFVNPLEFDNTDQQRQKVISYIKNGTLHKYCDSEDDACHPNILQLSQADNLTAFIELSAIQNKEYLNSLIDELESYFEVHLNTANTIKKAIRIVDVYKYSWFDSLIIAAALESGCSVLLSEDMQHNQLIENKLTIVNPFL